MSDDSETAAASERSMTPSAGAKLIEAGATLIDVRRTYEYDAGHLEGARNIEINELSFHAAEVPRDRPVLFYCRSGNRSTMAVEAFREAGWDAHHLVGGIQAWAAEGRPLEPADGEIAEPLPPS